LSRGIRALSTYKYDDVFWSLKWALPLKGHLPGKGDGFFEKTSVKVLK
jgi:hypothetical protein